MKRKRTYKKKNAFHQSAKPAADIEIVSYPIRLNKYIAKCGVCSRRNAAELVKAGEINLNGIVATEPFIEISDSDVVKYQGKELKPETKLVYLLLNKPRNVITTTSDERNRATVLDLIKEKGKERLFPVGRLDRQTTGLLMLTNDGDLAKKLSHPSHKIKKEYLVRLDKDISAADFEAVANGLMLDDGAAPVQELAFHQIERKDQLRISIQMGRNRIVRRIFEHLGYEVKALDRIYYAGLTKKSLPRGSYRTLSPREVIMLKHFT